MPASEVVLNGVFYLFAAAIVLCSVLVATSRNIIRSAFSLVGVLFGAAAIYALAGADFIAASQVLIYVGGILVLIIFAVMLTHRITDVKISNDSTPGPASFFACLCLLFALVVAGLFSVEWRTGAEPVAASSGGAEVSLLQWQADGRTGLPRGGSTHDDALVLGVAVDRAPEGAKRVQLVASRGGQDRKPMFEPLPKPGEVARFRLEGLEEGAWRWRVRLGEAELSAPGEAPDFVVRRGVTEAVAWGLAGPYLLAFEVVSVLLLAALVGAAFLARKEVRE